MTRILLIGNYPGDRQYSMQRYSNWLSLSLARQGWSVETIAPPVRFGRFATPGTRVGNLLGYVDKYLLFSIGLLFRSNKYDLVHICDHSNAPYALFIRSRKILVTCHDLIAVKAALGRSEGPQTRRSGRILQSWILWSLRRIKFVLCVSQATASDVENIVGSATGRLFVVPNPCFGCSPMPVEEADRKIRSARLPDFDRPFILHVGWNGWNKNRRGVLEIFLGLMDRPQFANFTLVLVGPKLPEPWLDEVKATSAKGRIFEITDPANDVLLAIYSKASVLLFPSLEEGFGWPILDAQACGCPVITSDREPMKSVGGAAAFYIDPLAPETAVNAIDENWQWIQSQRMASIENTQRFSEQTVIEQYLTVYDSIVETEPNTFPTKSNHEPIR